MRSYSPQEVLQAQQRSDSAFKYLCSETQKVQSLLLSLIILCFQNIFFFKGQI